MIVVIIMSSIIKAITTITTTTITTILVKAQLWLHPPLICLIAEVQGIFAGSERLSPFPISISC